VFYERRMTIWLSHINIKFNPKENHMTASATDFETKQHPWWLVLMGGILSVVIGVLLLTVPAKTVIALTLALGIYWIIQGIFTLVGMFMDHSAWGWKLFIGIISILAGFAILSYPLYSALALPKLLILILGIQGLIYGTVMLIMAFKGGGWGAGILGALSIIFGLILMANWQELMAVVTLVWVAAFFALFAGLVQIFQAFRQRTD
jgi:uncharacterized membrane protein HdeD (DUF308 family)